MTLHPQIIFFYENKTTFCSSRFCNFFRLIWLKPSVVTQMHKLPTSIATILRTHKDKKQKLKNKKFNWIYKRNLAVR